MPWAIPTDEQLAALPVSDPMRVYLARLASALRLRVANADQDSPEEDAILDEVDGLFRGLSDVEAYDVAPSICASWYTEPPTPTQA